MPLLNESQQRVTEEYFRKLAYLRGEDFLDIHNKLRPLLSSSTETYCDIMLEAGGDPRYLAEKRLGKITLSTRFYRATANNPEIYPPRRPWY